MKRKKVPLRRCIGCMEMKEKKELIRVVKSPEGEIFLDETGRKNGRGAYLCKNLSCFRKAQKSKALNREFKTEIPDDIYRSLEKQLEDCSGG
ncbi:MAG TPA: YlxR family protein [Clostridia bacterium]